jgi:hypothetical protein
MYASGSRGPRNVPRPFSLGWTEDCEHPAEMARPIKTASELEQMILARVRDEMVCPQDFQVRVICVGSRWDAFAELIDKEKHPDCLARVVLIASDREPEVGNIRPREV